MLAILKYGNVKDKWNSWQKEPIRLVMIWQLLMQRTIDMLHFREELFKLVSCAKYAHYLLGVDGKGSNRPDTNTWFL